MYQYQDGASCPVCNEGTLEKTVVDEYFEYKGKRLIVPNYIVYQCNRCQEEFVDEKTIKQTEKAIRDFHRSVDNLLTSDEIVALRKILGLTQAELADQLGVSRPSIARYENGQLTQSKSLDFHLRSLEKDNVFKSSKRASIEYTPIVKQRYKLKIAADNLNDQEIEDNYNNGKYNEEALAA